MKALMLLEYGCLEFQDVPKPEIEADDVLVRVAACGICGSDIHGLDGSTGRRQPPLIMGHEAAGTIAAVGARVEGRLVGDRVTFDSTVYCGDCYFCRRGDINLCDNRRVLGVSTGEYRRHGAMAEYVIVPERILYRLPDGLSFERAAMVEPVSIAVHAVNRTRIVLNDTAVVVGVGMIGLLVVQALRAAGCGRVYAIDLDTAKLKLARELGADDGFSPELHDPVKEILDRTGGRGADIALEAVGTGATVQTAIACLRKGGQLTVVGNLSPGIDFPLQALVTRELTVNGSCASCGEYAACLDMIADGRINVDALISTSAPLSEGALWFDRLHRGEAGLMKVLLKP